MESDATRCTRPACPVCDGPVIEVRSKLVCARCRAIVETCCDGGKQSNVP
jgi:hypothetical protein